MVLYPSRCSGCSRFTCNCEPTQQLEFDFSDVKVEVNTQAESSRLHLVAVRALTEELAESNAKLYRCRILLATLDKVLNGGAGSGTHSS